MNVRMLNDKEAIASVPCPFCGKVSEVHINDVNKLIKWANGEGLVQNMLSDLNAENREILISGICIDCQNKMFGEE